MARITPINLGDVLIDGKAIVWNSLTVTGSKNVDLSGSLSSIDYVYLTLGTDVSLDAMWLNYATNGTTLTVKVWKPSSSSDNTPTAATANVTVSYLVIGNPV